MTEDYLYSSLSKMEADAYSSSNNGTSTLINPDNYQQHHHPDPTTVDLVRFTLSTIATTVYLMLVVVVMDDLKSHRKKIQNKVGI